MFANISINEDKKGKNYIYKNFSQCEMGRKEWQQDYNTINHSHYINKDVKIM